MASWFSSWWTWVTSLFWTKSLEVSVVGLQSSGKTSFVNVLDVGGFMEDVVPTIAFNMRKVRRDNVTLKIWDVAGQSKYRGLWARYCRDSDAIVFIVDSHDKENLEASSFALHSLLSEKSLSGIPLLVLGNKNDLPGHVPVEELVKIMKLDTIMNRPVSCYSCSMRSQHNLDVVLKWLSKRAS